MKKVLVIAGILAAPLAASACASEPICGPTQNGVTIACGEYAQTDPTGVETVPVPTPAISQPNTIEGVPVEFIREVAEGVERMRTLEAIPAFQPHVTPPVPGRTDSTTTTSVVPLAPPATLPAPANIPAR